MIKRNLISREKLRYSRITPHIYIGINMLEYRHFKQLRRLGISIDVDLESERLEKIPMKGLETFLWLPTRDGHAPSHDQLAAGVAFLDQMVKHKKKVYVHCKNGHGRAPTLVAAYFTARGVPPERAVAFVKKRRPVVHLTKEQTTAVKRFSEIYGKHDSK